MGDDAVNLHGTSFLVYKPEKETNSFLCVVGATFDFDSYKELLLPGTEVFLSEAEKIKDLIVEYRRQIHSIAETGVDLPKTTKYIEETLAQIGIDSVMMGGGIVGRVGRAGGNVLLLRADCDALPMCEETGLSFCY